MDAVVTAGAAFLLRPAAPADETFLRALYRDIRDEELSLTGWSEADKQAFTDFQFRVREASRSAAYPEARRFVIEEAGVPAGELVTCQDNGALLIVDFAIAARCRNRGLGGRVLSHLKESAGSVELHVEQRNRALALYLRHGFRIVSETGLHYAMIWSSAAGR